MRFASVAGGTRTPGIYVTINGQIFQNGAVGGQVLAYDDFHNGNQRALPYTFNINLEGGDQLAIVAATNDTVTYQEFSDFFIEPVAVPGRWAFVCVLLGMGRVCAVAPLDLLVYVSALYLRTYTAVQYATATASTFTAGLASSGYNGTALTAGPPTSGYPLISFSGTNPTYPVPPNMVHARAGVQSRVVVVCVVDIN